jgi:hypothetical protein
VFAIVDEACGGKFCARQVLEVESEGEALRSVAAVPCWPSSPPSLHASLMARLDWSSDRQVRPHQPLSHRGTLLQIHAARRAGKAKRARGEDAARRN